MFSYLYSYLKYYLNYVNTAGKTKYSLSLNIECICLLDFYHLLG